MTATIARQKMPARQLRPVVAADRLRLSALRHDRIQHSRHSPTGETGIHFQRQTLARVRIHHAQHPDRSSTLHRIVHKIQRPLLVGRSPRQQRLSFAHAMLPLLPPNHQSRRLIHAMHALVVHTLSRAAQQNMQPPIPETRLLPRQLSNTLKRNHRTPRTGFRLACRPAWKAPPLVPRNPTISPGSDAPPSQ